MKNLFKQIITKSKGAIIFMRQINEIEEIVMIPELEEIQALIAEIQASANGGVKKSSDLKNVSIDKNDASQKHIIEENQIETEITDQQLKMLSRINLLILIRDLEKELKQVREEKENLLLAYRVGAEK